MKPPNQGLQLLPSSRVPVAFLGSPPICARLPRLRRRRATVPSPLMLPYAIEPLSELFDLDLEPQLELWG
jgi:hypothetical protein